MLFLGWELRTVASNGRHFLGQMTADVDSEQPLTRRHARQTRNQKVTQQGGHRMNGQAVKRIVPLCKPRIKHGGFGDGYCGCMVG